MAIEIVDFPIKNGGSFQFATLNYQRVVIATGKCPGARNQSSQSMDWVFRRNSSGDPSGGCVCVVSIHLAKNKVRIVYDCLWLSMIVYDCLWFMIVYDLWLSMSVKWNDSAIFLVTGSHGPHSISFHRNALRRQGIGHDHPGNDRGFDPNGAEGPSWRWDLRDLRVRVSPLRSDIYGESRIFWDRTSSKSKGKFHGKFTVRDFDECGKPNAMNHPQWALWNELCRVCHGMPSVVGEWWMIQSWIPVPWHWARLKRKRFDKVRKA